jgi:hypothetical protein
MVHIITKSTTKQELDAMLSMPRKNRKTINLEKYSGKVKFGMDALEYQKKIRNEWR